MTYSSKPQTVTAESEDIVNFNSRMLYSQHNVHVSFNLLLETIIDKTRGTFMEYKRSQYNVEIGCLNNGDILMFNTLTGAFCKVDAETQPYLQNSNFFDIERVADSKVRENLNLAGRLGFIVESTKDEVSAFLIGRMSIITDTHGLGLTIGPTMDCNMCCPYCYENKSPIYMSKETMDQLVQFVTAYFDRYKETSRFSVTWYGGEPLMHLNAIRELSRRFIELCEARNIRYNASIITNGALLNADTAKLLSSECKVSYAQITIDGIGEYHNRKRILKNGGDSYGIIMKNIDDSKEYLKIHVRVNVDKKNAGQLDAMIKEFYVEHQWGNNPELYFAPVEDYSDSCNLSGTCFQRKEFAELNTALIKSHYAINKETVRSLLYPIGKKVHCSAEMCNSYVVDPEGYLYKCWLDIGNKKVSCGHISKPFLVTEEYAKWVLSEIPQKCKECVYLPICQGGCGNDRIRKGEPRCPHTIYNLKDKLLLAYEDYLSKKDGLKEEA